MAGTKEFGWSGSMVRNAKRKSLYESIISARSKPVYEQVPHKPAQPDSAGKTNPANEALPASSMWANRLKYVQAIAGRLEFSVPYTVAVAVALGLILVMLLIFRLGQWSGARAVNQPAKTDAGIVNQAITAELPASTGKNRIVLKAFQVKSQLEPLKEYFDRMGVATEILERNGWYYLVTKNKYQSIEKSGSDGYLAKQKIVEIGAGYKAPTGYETFRKAGGSADFSDAFGMKFED
jgi:hypothetical protein